MRDPPRSWSQVIESTGLSAGVLEGSILDERKSLLFTRLRYKVAIRAVKAS